MKNWVLNIGLLCGLVIEYDPREELHINLSSVRKTINIVMMPQAQIRSTLLYSNLSVTAQNRTYYDAITNHFNTYEYAC